MMKKYAVVVAGGTGTRMGNAVPKQFLPVLGRMLLWYTVRAFLEAYDDMQVILVLPVDTKQWGEELLHRLADSDRVQVVAGGLTRFHSVQNGLARIEGEAMVFVHDGVRCLVTPELIRHCYEEALSRGNAVPAVAATDSIRLIDDEGSTVADRSRVRLVQTPQTFRASVLAPAFQQEYITDFTDEATVVEAMGHEIFLVEGDPQNIKITRPADLLVAAQLLAERGWKAAGAETY